MYQTLLLDISGNLATITLNRPEKRNAINPALSFEMLEVFEALESDERCGALVLTGAGEAYSSGMDLREYFRATDKLNYDERLKVMRKSAMAQWKRLQFFGKPTIEAPVLRTELAARLVPLSNVIFSFRKSFFRKCIRRISPER